jgi:manganese/iron transport system permease protein
MLETLLTPLHYDYMLKAIFVSAVIGGVCAFLSCFITLKGWSLMGDALSHSVVPGVAVAYYAGWPFAAGAFVTGLLAAVGMGFVKTKTRLREDAVIGVVFTAFFALGLLLNSLYPSQVELR